MLLASSFHAEEVGWGFEGDEGVPEDGIIVDPAGAFKEVSAALASRGAVLRSSDTAEEGELFDDIILAAGGGLLGHPHGYRAGAEAWRQAIHAVMNDIPIDEYARKPENKSLRGAIEKWGYFERPETPWLRMDPKFRPKEFKL